MLCSKYGIARNGCDSLERPMARPTQLVEGIARAFGVPEPTVMLHFRNLREAGLRGVSQRGRGAGNVTARDAAHLLLAVAGSPHVKNSVLPVERNGRMMTSEGAWRLTETPVAALQALRPDHTFADALEALVRAYVDDEHNGIRIAISIREPTPWSSIEVMSHHPDDHGTPFHREYKTYARRRPTGVGNLSFDPPLDLTIQPDLMHEHSFTDATIVAVAALLRGST